MIKKNEEQFDSGGIILKHTFLLGFNDLRIPTEDITEDSKGQVLNEVEGYIKRFKNLRNEIIKIDRLNINDAAFYRTGDPVQDLLNTHRFLAYESYKDELLWNSDKIEEVKQRLERTIGALTEQDLLTRFALALGFTPSNVNYIVDKALSLLVLNVDLDTFIYEMQHMNK